MGSGAAVHAPCTEPLQSLMFTAQNFQLRVERMPTARSRDKDQNNGVYTLVVKVVTHYITALMFTTLCL